MRHSTITLLVLLVAGCAVGEPGGPSSPPPGTGTPTAARGVYVPVRADAAVSKTGFAPGYAPLPIFLNPRGGTYKGGSDDANANLSSVVASTGRAEVSIPAWGGDVASWNALVACVQAEFGDFNVSVSDVEPSTGPYIEAVIGGTGVELGMAGYAGVAPIDTGACKLIDRAVVFVFEQKLTDVRSACEATVAQIGHAMTLDHTYDCTDPMSYLGGCGERSFQDSGLACGELAERPCVCERARQNSVEILTAQLGAAGKSGSTSDCLGLDYAGSCSSSGVLAWCDAGHGRTLDCAANGLECGASADPELGNDCVPPKEPEPPADACMGIDFLGVCSDEGVLTYCLNGELQTIDCAAIGEECVFVNETLGNFCVVPEPPPSDACGEIDFFGQCSEDGTVLTYCLEGSLQVNDCGAFNRVCAFVNDQIGFGCVLP